MLDEFEAQRAAKLKSTKRSPARAAKRARLDLGKMNDAHALQRASEAKLEVKSAAVFVQVEEFRSIENSAPIATDKFVCDNMVPSFCRGGRRWLNAKSRLYHGASISVLGGTGGFFGEADR